ncbi:Hms1p Ecym_1333 [Eremothecium cymbalariae DBVPG|uniref:BHLH domain-containing protein n=1 Tax=Eremothecium cymbalariae (strain CBS 270.75 / DBVPG 7215 / KCTC 17166 / NRRL Y-17582) TaxID=931890 RepID=G8JNA4_ERECY|nr:hypothetical protein Ecym_1333 [Eremothecium cymbalariae DBVPG\
MCAAMRANGSLFEVEMFLASLQSEDSDNDSYDLFNTPQNQAAYASFGGRPSIGGAAVDFTPESSQSHVGFVSEPVKGVGYTGFTSPAELSDGELRWVSKDNTILRVVKMESSSSGETGDSANLPTESSEPPSSVQATGGKTATTAAVAASVGAGIPVGGLLGNGRITKPKRERMSHNIIEKKYRTNINDKILQLRDIVPTLRVTTKLEGGIPVTAEDELQLDGLHPARKLNKASILTKTIEYIRHLEGRCSSLKLENMKLKQGQSLSTPESLRQPSQNGQFLANGSGAQPPTTMYSSDVSSVATPSYNMAHAYPQSQDSGKSSSKLLLGGLAMTMGITSFGENDDINNVRGLFTMPVFHYSPATNGFTLSNIHGIKIDLCTSLLSLLRLILLLFTVIRLATMLLVERRSGDNDKAQMGVNSSSVLIQYSDTLAFDSPGALWTTLKKTLIINRLKYPKNSIERVESEIAKCFALKVYARSSRFFRLFLNSYSNSCWVNITEQVKLTNIIASKKNQNFGIEWEMITNILNSATEKTLNNQDILYSLQHYSKNAYSLRAFVTFINDSAIASNTLSIISSLMQELTTDDCDDLETTVKRIYDVEIKNGQFLKFARENYIVLNALFNLSDVTTRNLLNLLEVDQGVTVENIKKDHLFVLYSSIFRRLIVKHQFKELPKWSQKMPLCHLRANSCSLLGITGMYLALHGLMQHETDLPVDIFVFLEELANRLRVWFGSEAGDVLDLEVRGKLIEYCMNAASICSKKSDQSTLSTNLSLRDS